MALTIVEEQTMPARGDHVEADGIDPLVAAIIERQREASGDLASVFSLKT
jgi:hypothetical protein